ncbi:TetR/AcrR family transcriptional regulator [Cryptosporangium minutisporangium]|uniref:HTH tetR-type domain-containing protein n=1 Tax=Cryptosporangium minutisporangium TaxID=113569 RepID=A0ABP6T2I7_9ACTN
MQTADNRERTAMARVSSDDRRQQLVAAALAVLAEDGPAAVTTRRVAERAGAPLATVHYAFRNKDELLQATVDAVMTSFATALRESVRPERGLRDAVADCLRGYWGWVRDHEDLALASIEILAGGLRAGGTATAALAAAGDLLVGWFSEAVGHDPAPPRVPVADLARLTLVAAEGLTLIYLAHRDAVAAEADLARIIAALQAQL